MKIHSKNLEVYANFNEIDQHYFEFQVKNEKKKTSLWCNVLCNTLRIE